MDLKIKGGQEFTDEEQDDVNQFIIMFREKHNREIAVVKTTDLSIEKDHTGNDVIRAYTLDEIRDIVCGIMKVTKEQFCSKSRKRNIVMTRHIFFYISKVSGHTLREIADKAGKQDHTTVIHGINKFKEMIETRDLEFVEAYRESYLTMGNRLPLLAYV